MNFDFSDEQNLLRDQARKFLTDKCPTTEVRTILNGDAAHHALLWSEIGQMGWCGAAIPEEFGGLGMGYLELCVIAEELGRAVAPVPFSSTIYLYAEALLEAGSTDQKTANLGAVAEGAVIGTLAVTEAAGDLSPRTIRARVEGNRLSGTKIAVPDGSSAQYAVVLARSDTGDGERGLGLYRVDLTSPGVSRTTIDTLDPSRDQANITFENAPAELLSGDTDGWGAVQRVLDKAAVLFAFEQVGGAQAALEMGRDYACERFAFGRPIGSYQAIKHRLADMYVTTELARSNAYYGAWALAAGDADLPLAAATARVSATEAYGYCAKENTQVHGGMGFTWELDCHLYYRRSKLIGLAIGSQPYWKNRLISHLERKNSAA